MKKTSHFWPLAVGAATLFYTINLRAQPQLPRASDDTFAPIGRLITENNFAEASKQLKAMKAAGLKPDQFTRWETLAARTAVRMGDTKWLQEINDSGSLATGADELVTLSATRLLFANRLDETRSTLENIKKPYEMSEIPRRRYEQLYMKLEQLSGDKAAETKWAGKLVEFVSGWEDKNCQSCHANPNQYGAKTTQFPLDSWWVGERYATLMREDGTALKTEREARAALLKNPKDEAAQIRLGYALRAQNRAKESEAALREIPWSRWSDKPLLKPLRLAQFP